MISDLAETRGTLDRLPPYSLESEMCVIGSMALAGNDPALMAGIRACARSDDFFQVDHQILFDVMCSIADTYGTLDAMLLREELIRRHLLDEVGGIEYLMSILNSVPNAANGTHYAGIVREKSTLRRLITAATEVLRRCYGPTEGDQSDEIAREFLSTLYAVAEGRASETIVRIDRVIDEVLQTRSDGVATRIATGLKTLDDICGGLPIGGYTIVAGRPGMGKSQLGKQIVRNVAAQGINAGIVSVEETRQKIGQNYLSAVSKVENNRITYGTCGEQEWRCVEDMAPSIRGLPIFITDRPVRLADVESAVTTMVTRYKCGLVFVDYLQLIHGPEAGNKEQEIAKISMALKNLFKGLGTAAGLVAAQLSRANETGAVRRPELKDLRHSGQIEQDGDLILMLHREDYYRYKQQGFTPTHTLEAMVAKNKSGPLGRACLQFEGKYQTVTDRTGVYAEPPVIAEDEAELLESI